MKSRTVRDLSVRAGNALHTAIFGKGVAVHEDWLSAEGDEIRERLEKVRKKGAEEGVFQCRHNIRFMLACQRGCGMATLREIMIFIGEPLDEKIPKHVCICRTCGEKMS